jgi:hypothetical protein
MFKAKLADLIYGNSPAFWEDVYLIENVYNTDYKILGKTDSMPNCLAAAHYLMKSDVNIKDNKKGYSCFFGIVDYIGIEPVWRDSIKIQ